MSRKSQSAYLDACMIRKPAPRIMLSTTHHLKTLHHDASLAKTINQMLLRNDLKPSATLLMPLSKSLQGKYTRLTVQVVLLKTLQRKYGPPLAPSEPLHESCVVRLWTLFYWDITVRLSNHYIVLFKSVTIWLGHYLIPGLTIRTNIYKRITWEHGIFNWFRV